LELWILFTALFGIFKGIREPVKKKALEKSDLISTLFTYTLIGFIIAAPTARDAFEIEPYMLIYIGIKSLVIFGAWIAAFSSIKKLPVSLYGVIDLSRVIFSTLLGVLFLHESLTVRGVVSLVVVVAGLYLVKRTEHKGSGNTYDYRYILLTLLSCLLNAVSGTLDKYTTSTLGITSSQLQFWFMLMLTVMYFIYMMAKGKPDIKGCIKNPYIYVLAVLLVLGDRLLFIANSSEQSKVTVMILIKQCSVIVTIICGKLVYKEKIASKLVCAGIIIAGIAIAIV